MQAAKDPPKAKSEGHTKDYKRTRLKLPPQSSGLLWHPVTLLLGPQNHAVSALQGTAVVGISSKKLNDKCQYVKSISSCDLSLKDMWHLSSLNLCLKSEYIWCYGDISCFDKTFERAIYNSHLKGFAWKQFSAILIKLSSAKSWLSKHMFKVKSVKLLKEETKM